MEVQRKVTIKDRILAYKEECQWKQQIYSLEIIEFLDELVKQLDFESAERVKEIEKNCNPTLDEKRLAYLKLTGKEAFRGWNEQMIDKQIARWNELIPLGITPAMKDEQKKEMEGKSLISKKSLWKKQSNKKD